MCSSDLVSGAPYGVSAGDWVVRQPLQAVIQLNNQALKTGQACQTGQTGTALSMPSASQSTDTRSPLDGKSMDDNSKEEIEFLDTETTSFNIEDDGDEPA